MDQRVATGAQVAVADDRDGTTAYARVTVSFALAAFLTSCSLPFPRPEPVQPAEVTLPKRELPAQEHPPEEVKVTRNDEIILLPKADGSVGAVVVRQDGVEIVLDKAYASVVIEGPGQVRQLIRDPGGYKGEILRNPCGIAAQASQFPVVFPPGER